MEKFEIEKNGYDKKQVDDYVFVFTNDYESKLNEQKMRISDLKRELAKTNEELEIYKKKNSNISDALVVAVETAKQIETSSKNIYELEIKRVRSLYDKWKNFLDDFMKKYPELRAKYDTNLLLKVFKEDIDRILNQNKESISQKEAIAMQTSTPEDNTIGLRMLINKMNSDGKVVLHNDQKILKGNMQVERNPKPSDETLAKYNVDLTFEEEEKRILKDQIKPIVDIQKSSDENYENLVDKFLTSDEDDYSSAYSKILLEKQKNDAFDLKEAVTPTEDLEEIMKSFSFYPDNDNDND